MGQGRAVQAVLEDTEAALRTSADRLRACGQVLASATEAVPEERPITA